MQQTIKVDRSECTKIKYLLVSTKQQQELLEMAETYEKIVFRCVSDEIIHSIPKKFGEERKI